MCVPQSWQDKTMEYVKIILLIMGLVCTQATFVDNPCGTLGYIHPITNTRPVHLTFTPTAFDNSSDIQWKLDRDGTIKVLSNTTKGMHMFTEGETFHLELTDWSVSDYDYFIAQYGNCESRYLKLKETDLGDCGMLDVRPRNVTSGQRAEIVYLPASSVWTDINSTAGTWFFSCGQTCEAVNISEKYDVKKRPSEAEYVLTIPSVDHAIDNGVYYVRCEDGTSTNNITIEAIVLEPPSHPVISPLTTIDGHQYIVGINNEPLKIICNTTGGTEPVRGRLLVGKEPLSSVLHDAGYMTNEPYTLTGSHHMTEVTCEVANPAVNKPLVATNKIYMIQTPVNPKFVVNEAVEYKPANIFCSVTKGRPAPNITFKIGREVVKTDQDTRFIEDTQTYSSKASLNSLERRWNGKSIRCCFSNELYRPSTTTCTGPQKISYKYRWEALSLNLPKIAQEVRPYNVINVTCIVENANPRCGIIWAGKRSLFLKESPGKDARTPDGGVTSQTTATLNVTAEDNGDSVKCSTDCQLFTGHTIVYEIRIPAHPKVFINISASNTSVVEVSFGDSLVLECSAKSEPRSEISWHYVGNKTGVRVTTCGSLSESECLGIDYAGSIHDGLYTCAASNKFGSANKTIELLVTGQPMGFGDLGLPALSNLLLIVLGTVGFLFLLSLLGALTFVIARKTKGKASNSGEAKEQANIPQSAGNEKGSGHVIFENCSRDTEQVQASQEVAFPEVSEVLVENAPEFDPVLGLMLTTFTSEPDLTTEPQAKVISDEPDDMKQAADGKQQENTLLTMDDIQKITPLGPSKSLILL